MRRVFDPEAFPALVGPIPFLGLATLSQAGVSFMQQGIVISDVFFAALYHLNMAQMGLVTTGLSVGFMTSRFITGSIVDRLGPRRLLFFSSLAMSGLAVVLTTVTGFAELLVMAALVGAALAVTPTAGTKAVFAAFAERPRGMVMGIRQSGVPLGAACAALFVPRLAATMGIGATFWCYAGELLLVGWMFAGVILPGTGGRERRPAAHARGGVLKKISRPALVAGLMVSGQYILLGFSISDLHQIHRFSLFQAGLVLAAAQIGGGISRILTGVISDRLMRRSAVLAACGFLAACMAETVAVLPASVSLWEAVAVWFLFGMGAVGWNALAITWGGELVEPERAGFAMSGVGTAANLGAAIFPPLFGWIVDSTHRFAMAWGLLGVVLLLAAGLAMRFDRKSRAIARIA